MSQPKVSVIMPCYNARQYLADALASATDQDYAHLEVVVVDDGSTDGSEEIVAAFPRARCIRQPNGGTSAARNTGIRESTGDFIVFLDADDKLLPGAVALGVSELQSRPKCAFVYGFSRTINGDGRPKNEPPRPPVKDANYFTLLAGQGLVPPAVAMFRRGAVEHVGGFDTRVRIVEDHDFYLRLAREFPIYCHNRVVAEYRYHDLNMSRLSTTDTLQAVLGAIDAQEEWIARAQQAAFDGRRHWRRLFGPYLAAEVTSNLKRKRFRRSVRALFALVRHYPKGFFEYVRERFTRARAKRGGQVLGLMLLVPWDDLASAADNFVPLA